MEEGLVSQVKHVPCVHSSSCTYLVKPRVGAASKKTVELYKCVRRNWRSVGNVTHFYKEEEIRVLALWGCP